MTRRNRAPFSFGSLGAGRKTTARAAKSYRLKSVIVAWVAAVLLVVSGSGVRAASLGAGFPSSMTLGRASLHMKGRGIFRVYGLFAVSEIALYGPHDVSSRRLLSTGSAKCIRIRFFASVSRADFVQIAEAHLRDLYAPPEWARLETRIHRWHAAYPDSREGDELSLCFQPQSGLSMTHNRRHLVSVPGHDFAKVILGLLFGESPLSDELKQSLLSGAT